ncbi:sporulation protein [Gulbenkiania mobilis]|uniref:sporulation protein n=1 Tax=Gulbenkiania mobilis TaxID=397457 RepID=UPI0006BBF5A8|nr:sporulation protein [Gulbenkiania mobilis]
MLKKLLASIGVGGTTVDTVLDHNAVLPGEVLSGQILIRGGTVDQTIDHIDLVLMTEAEVDDGDHERRVALPLGVFRASGSLTATAGEEIVLPFAFTLPLETPVNHVEELRSPNHPYLPLVQVPVWLHTDLAIDHAVDAEDRDYVYVRPLPQMRRLIAAFESLGLVLYSADVEQGTARAGTMATSLGCYQELEFRPAATRHGGLQEVEITFIPHGRKMAVLMEIDRSSRGDGYSAFVMDEAWEAVDWVAELARRLA